jgi:choline dehydrogenase-like flavoprotein
MLDGRALDVIEEFGSRQHQVNVRRPAYFGLLEQERRAPTNVGGVLTPAQQTVLAAVVDTFVPSDADADATFDLVAAAVEKLPAHRRDKLALVLGLLANPAVCFLLCGRPRGFPELSRAARERVLRRLAAVPPLRPAYDAFARLALFGAYTVADERGRSAVWDRIGYPGPRADVPAGAAAFPVSAPPQSGRLVADAVVVGSGAGGGVAAALLAQAGLRVVVLEAGPVFEPVAARQREAEAMAELYLEAGLCSSDDLGVSILAGACVGGGTAVNWSTSLRLPPALAASWGDALGRPRFADELAAAYDAVEARLGVTVATAHNRNNAVIVDGCAQLGWEARAIPRNAECYGDGCGYCGFGCAYGNKRSTAATYLRDAVDAGAAVYARVRVECVRIEAGLVRGVDAVIEDNSSTLVVDAPLVVVAAGSLRTPGILARSGVDSPHLGRHLHLHPTSALSAQFDEPVEAWHGAMQTALCDRFAPPARGGRDDDGLGAVIEAAPAHPGLMALALPWSGRDAHAEAMTSARYRATLIALTRDRGEGSVGLDDRADVRYRVADDDASRLAAALAGAARIAFAAGATSVSTLHATPLELTAAEATPARLDTFARTLQERAATRAPLAVFSAHQMGTARMSAEAEYGVLDPDGRVYGLEGLLVTDASAFPSASGVNPMLTIMALAHRATSALIARRAASSPSGSPARSRS